MIPMELKKFGIGNSAVAPALEWKKLAMVVRSRRTTLFATGFAFTLFVCTIFMAFNNPNKLVTNPMDQGQSWFPSMFSNSTRSRTFFKFIFPNSESSAKVDNSTQNPQKGHEYVVDDDKKGVPEDSSENKDRNSTQKAPFIGSVPNTTMEPDVVNNPQKGRESMGDNMKKIPEDGFQNNGKDTDRTQLNSFNDSVPVSSTKPDVVNSPQKDLESMENDTKRKPEDDLENKEKGTNVANKTASSGATQDKPVGVSNITESKGAEISNGSSETVEKEKKCDIFYGSWVPDDTKPLYPPGSCPHIDESFNCFRNRRPDNDYEKWRWQPKDCDIPRFNATDMLERLRHKRLAFVGDSLNRNMWESMVCSLRHAVANKSRVHEISGRKEFRTEGFYAFLYEDYNCSVEFIRAPFLVQEWEVDEGNGTKKETLRLDKMDPSASKYRKADIVVFNTGHWWTHEKTSKGKDYYQEGNHVYTELNVLEAYRKALKTWAKWVDRNINPNKSLVFFRGYSATHFSGGQWNSGGQCHKESEPIYNETYLNKYNPKMLVLESVMQEMKTPVMYLNITRITDYRKDAHPSIYRKQYPSQEERIQEVRYQDCSHWCLPGVPDTWNELLYASLLLTGKGVWAT